MKSVNIAVIGECMIELQKISGQLKQTYGGDTLNTALYLTRLLKAQEINISYVTALGQDSFSSEMLEAWQEEGIDGDLVLTIEDKQPGIYCIETDEFGERRFQYWRNESAAKFMLQQPESAALLDKLHTYDAVYLSGITLAILTETGRNALFDFLESFSSKGGKVYFDNNYRAKLWKSREEAIACYRKVLQCTDIALLTFEDEQELFGDLDVEQCIERTTSMGVAEIIIKRGSKACLVVEQNGVNYVEPDAVSNIVDTTAAGDSFSAGFIARRLTGGNAEQAAQFGHGVAGAVIQHKGAIIPRELMPEFQL
ncbi:2-dehydro-3-deoxygluconokinase [Vibrio sp. MACH09]|uniref:sugar kinase n=1 Tax=Vibrio sp. MACH09 TaxID=3025122 RepID=UPI002793FFDA|nr:sugar kinase [Vibrio sp. MACH09]GLO62595.1 2-dehydro-3-deoxygluconokinase [Vibrio sp. MACH09]